MYRELLLEALFSTSSDDRSARIANGRFVCDPADTPMVAGACGKAHGPACAKYPPGGNCRYDSHPMTHEHSCDACDGIFTAL